MHEDLPKFAILGSGSIGTYIGAHLVQAGFPVVFVGRERNRKEVQLFGLGISDFTGKFFSIPPNKIEYVTDLKDVRGATIFLITVKSRDTKELGESLNKHLSSSEREKAIVLSFQNGVRNKSFLYETIPHLGERILAGMVPFNVVAKGKGQFHRGTSGHLVVQDNQHGKKVVQYLRSSGLEAETHPNMDGVLWGKLLFNLNNSLNALAGIPLREELSQRGYRRILSAMMSEAFEVLKLAGIRPVRTGKMIPQLAPTILQLPDWLFFRVASSLIKIDPEARSSMWEDLNQGRTTEVDSLNGEILKLADRVGHAAPINRAIVSLIREAEKKPKSVQFNPDTLANRLGLKF
ncbi:2-dehydropantoate 2-reductase [Leptospira fluminis]|uniref:2-dehydropantoate 2-reductase n=1 Tax=Leptospira fluminis TaxID=2484979 RepID=A0A4R9GS87_9LEPT|nr:2-dehydropantoate 2-reductase [Leptospira fluminis]TGK20873.1 2-dehydropantoate 2-reductase [Leptospira fluminis]